MKKKDYSKCRNKNVDIIDLSKNNSSKNNNLNKLIIYYGDYTFKNSALDMVSLLKKK